MIVQSEQGDVIRSIDKRILAFAKDTFWIVQFRPQNSKNRNFVEFIQVFSLIDHHR